MITAKRLAGKDRQCFVTDENGNAKPETIGGVKIQTGTFVLQYDPSNVEDAEAIQRYIDQTVAYRESVGAENTDVEMMTITLADGTPHECPLWKPKRELARGTFEITIDEKGYVQKELTDMQADMLELMANLGDDAGARFRHSVAEAKAKKYMAQHIKYSVLQEKSCSALYFFDLVLDPN